MSIRGYVLRIMGPIQTHKYPADLSQVFVVLRVKDKNGQNNVATKRQTQLPLTLTVFGILVFIGFIGRKVLLDKKPRVP